MTYWCECEIDNNICPKCKEQLCIINDDNKICNSCNVRYKLVHNMGPYYYEEYKKGMNNGF